MDDIKQLLLELIKLGFLSNELNNQGGYKEADGIFGPRTKQAYLDYLNTNKQTASYTPRTLSETLAIEANINSKNNEDIINTYYANNPSNTPYIIDDKKNNTLNVYINGNLIKSFKAIHGKYSTTFGNHFNKKVADTKNYTIQSGDYLSTLAKRYNTTVSKLQELNEEIKNPNFLRIGLVIKVPSWHYEDTIVDPDEMTITYTKPNLHIDNLKGNLATPAGVYFTTRSGSYGGAPSFIRRTQAMVDKNNPKGIPSSIHARDVGDVGVVGANTNGCTGLSKEDLQTLNNLLKGYENVPTYILPVNSDNKFAVRNGKLSFKSHDLNLTPSHHEKDYTPIKTIHFSTKGLDDHQKKVYTDFSKGLIRYKTMILKELGINNDTYIQLALAALGILGVESNYGKQHTAIDNLARFGNKVAHKVFGMGSASSPDVYSKYKTYGINGDNNSIGLTQIRLSNLDKTTKELFRRYGITKDSLFDPVKAAIATMFILSRNYLDRGMNIQKAVSGWNNANGYYDRVMNVSKRAKILQNSLNYNK